MSSPADEATLTRASRYVLRVDGKGRITLPLPAREALGVGPGALVELVVDASTRTVAVRPLTVGVLASYRVSVPDRRGLADLVSAILEEGSDLRRVECWESECVVEVLAIDAVMVERVAEKLRAKGIGVEAYTAR